MKKEKPLHLLLKPDSWWNTHHTLWIIPWDQKRKTSKPESDLCNSWFSLGAPGGRRLPRKFWHPRKCKLPESPKRALLVCNGTKVQAEQRTPEPTSHGSNSRKYPIPICPSPVGVKHITTSDRIHLCTHFISPLQILAPAPPSVHIFFFMWTSRLTTHHISHQPSEIICYHCYFSSRAHKTLVLS